MANDDYSWTCPYCRQVATIKGDNISSSTHVFDNGNKLGELGILTQVITCPSSKCREFTTTASLYHAEHTQGWPGCRVIGQPLLTWNLKPRSSAKPFPEYIPAPIRQDYEEACLVCNLSPKASATLSRRCLQGIIRDFWGITKARLIDEVIELKGKTDPPTWQAIDAVKSIGNIGAHMEKDIDLIVDVEPREAGLLLHLIEVLLEESYIRRHDREEHMQKVIATAQAKAAVKSSQNPSP